MSDGGGVAKGEGGRGGGVMGGRRVWGVVRKVFLLVATLAGAGDVCLSKY